MLTSNGPSIFIKKTLITNDILKKNSTFALKIVTY